jgi:3-hydroxyisobutyrate dehydrogenase-like beta-hydroxyacid dehydrogenase
LKVSFIGLGVMGYPMAAHLQQSGHQVTVFNRTRERAAQWVQQYNGRNASTPALAARDADIVFVCVGNDDDVRSVVLGEDGALAGMSRGSTLVDHTTASADLALELHALCQSVGVGFIDAPVSGGQAGAEKGVLTVMCGGTHDDFVKVEGVMASYARCVRLLGAAGSGQLAKMVNQICIAGIVQGLAEAMTFSERAGLDTAAVIEVIRQGAAQSWQMENRYQTMLEDQYNHGFAVDWMRKDLGLVQDRAQRLGLSLPVTELVDRYYADVQAMGGGRWDTSSLFKRMQTNIGE